MNVYWSRTLKGGDYYRIHPSKLYQQIPEGIVKIVSISTMDFLPVEYQETAHTYIQNKVVRSGGMWVVYFYPRGQRRSKELVLPLEIFGELISIL